MAKQAAKNHEWKARRKGQIVIIDVDVPVVDSSFEFRVMLAGDSHFDSRFANRKREREDLDAALAYNAPIVHCGDLFDAMQGPHDKRRSHDDARPENAVDAYFNSLLDDAEKRYAPYAKIFAVLGLGNHEEAVMRHNGIDLGAMISKRLRTDYGSPIQAMGFRGYVNFMFHINGTEKRSAWLYFAHGSGGCAPVTRGVIKSARRAVYLADADIVVSGHLHESWTAEIEREYPDKNGDIQTKTQLHIQVPSYKTDGSGRWEDSKEFAPQPTGSYWLKFRRRDRRLVYTVEKMI